MSFEGPFQLKLFCGSMILNPLLFRFITVQIGKTLGDFFLIKEKIPSKWIAVEERLF